MDIARGDGWELRCGDCLDPETGLASIERVDHVISDPPFHPEMYENIRTSAEQSALYASVRCKSRPKIGHIGTCDIPSVWAECARVAARWSVFFCSGEQLGDWREAMAGAWIRFGFWDKFDVAPQFSGDRPGVPGEMLAIAHPAGRKRWNGGGRRAYWSCGTGSPRKPGVRVHPCQKPLRLIEALVLDFTDPGDLVCDPFAGSGTTGVACLKHGRRFIGWEL